MSSVIDQRIPLLSPPSPSITGSNISIPLCDGTESFATLIRPVSPPQTGSPLILLFHDGGFVSGSPLQLTAYARAFAALFDAVCISAGYRLAPENTFPTPFLDAYDILVHISQNPQLYHADLSVGFVVGGISVGAHIAAVISHKYTLEKSEQQPALTGLWTALPFLFPSADYVPEKYKELWIARRQHVDGIVLDVACLEKMWEHLQPNFDSPLFTPFAIAGNNPDFTNHPRTFIQVTGMDPTRDDGLVYSKVLGDNGVDVKLDVYGGLPHKFWLAVGGVVKEETERYYRDAAKGMGWLLRREEVDGSVEINYLS
ncbi:hypothetical protein ABW19_dt0202713 [Dactylella cylindrospora]|nr:hypothetical protein ABW19_dt0202713 [Dactylella cylindrospora]